MAEPQKPVLQKPPGYRDPNTPPPPIQKPPQLRKPPPLPPFYPKKQRKSRCCRYCCCFICIFIIILIVLIGIAGAIFYLWFDPKLPSFHLNSLKIMHFNVTVKPDGTYLDAKTEVKFEATNPNKKITFYYDRIQVRMTVGDDIDFGSAMFRGFKQEKKNTTVLKFGTGVKSMLIDDSDGNKLKEEFRSKKLVVLVDVGTKFGIGVKGWKMGMMDVKVKCSKVSIKKSEGGSMPKCTINVLHWINIH